MKNIFEKINLVLLLGIFIFVGLNLYLNFTGYSNANTVLSTLKSDFLYDIPSEDKLKEGQIKGLVGSLEDPYTEYIPKDKAEKFNDSLNQRYEGIGVSFNFKNKAKVFVAKVFNNSPAQTAGIKQGDILIKVDGEDIASKSQEEIVNSIRGQNGTIVKITVIRTENNTSEEKIFDVTRAKVEVDLVESRVENNKLIINIKSFGDGVYSKFETEAKKALENDNIDTIVLNLLDNPGGRLDVAIDMISTFVPADKIVLKEKTKNETIELKSSKKNINLQKYKVDILINENSASASEILAASLKELSSNKVTIYGRKSYGKGVVQKVVNLTNGAILKYTIAEWLSPEGKSINKQGVLPDKLYPISVEDIEAEYLKEN